MEFKLAQSLKFWISCSDEKMKIGFGVLGIGFGKKIIILAENGIHSFTLAAVSILL